MVDLKVSKIFYSEKVNEKGKINKFYNIIFSDSNGNEYRSIVGCLNLSEAVVRYEYFNGTVCDVSK